MQQGVSSGLSELSSRLEGAVEEARACSLGYSAQAAAGLQAAQLEASSVVQTLVAGLGGQAAQVRQLGSRHAAGMQASLGALQSLSAAAQGHLSGGSLTACLSKLEVWVLR